MTMVRRIQLRRCTKKIIELRPDGSRPRRYISEPRVEPVNVVPAGEVVRKRGNPRQLAHKKDATRRVMVRPLAAVEVEPIEPHVVLRPRAPPGLRPKVQRNCAQKHATESAESHEIRAVTRKRRHEPEEGENVEAVIEENAVIFDGVVEVNPGFVQPRVQREPRVRPAECIEIGPNGRRRIGQPRKHGILASPERTVRPVVVVGDTEVLQRGRPRRLPKAVEAVVVRLPEALSPEALRPFSAPKKTAPRTDRRQTHRSCRVPVIYEEDSREEEDSDDLPATEHLREDGSKEDKDGNDEPEEETENDMEHEFVENIYEPVTLNRQRWKKMRWDKQNRKISVSPLLHSTGESSWMSDDIIDKFMISRLDGHKKLKYISTYSYWQEGGIEWTLPHVKDALDPMKINVMPFIKDYHWRLLIIWRNVISCYDPTVRNFRYGEEAIRGKRRGKNPTEKLEMIRIIAATLNMKLAVMKHTAALQKDSHNCGVFVMLAVQSLVDSNGKELTVKYKDVREFRQKFLEEAKEKNLFNMKFPRGVEVNESTSA